jgi:SAM-dependent methyltransferase
VIRNQAIYWVRRAASSLGYAINSVPNLDEPDLVAFLISRNVDLVLDVGANVGQFGTDLRRYGYKGEILSFEPLPAMFVILTDKAMPATTPSARNANEPKSTLLRILALARSCRRQ